MCGYISNEPRAVSLPRPQSRAVNAAQALVAPADLHWAVGLALGDLCCQMGMEWKLQSSSKHGAGHSVWFTVEKACLETGSLHVELSQVWDPVAAQIILTPQLNLVIEEEKVLEAAGNDTRVRCGNLVFLTVKWVFLSFVSSPESRDDSLGNCKIRMWLLTKSCSSLIALFIANQIISLDMHQQALIAYEITALLHRNEMSFWGQLRCHLNPRIEKEEKKKGKKSPSTSMCCSATEFAGETI